MTDLLRPRSAALGALMIAWLALASAVWADVVFLKDGFALHGRVRREMTQYTDPATGIALSIVPPSGAFLVDDGPRWTMFSFRQVRGEDGISEDNIRQGQLLFTRPAPAPRQPLPQSASFIKVGPFDDTWLRKFTVKENNYTYNIEQQLTHLSPYFARLTARNYVWHSWMLTQELGPNVVRRLLDTHPDLKEMPDQPDIEKRLKRYRFLAQANWYNEAEQELNRAEKDLPNAKDRIDESRKGLRDLRAAAILDEVERARAAGAYEVVQVGLDRLATDAIPDAVLGRATTLRVEYETQTAQVAKAKQLLADLRPLAQGGAGVTLSDIALIIESDINPDTVGRLDTFLTLADQAARDRKAGREPKQSPEQLLAVAVTGWLMGRNAAEANVSTALRLWKGRLFLLDYLRSGTAAERKNALASYQVSADLLGLDELTQLIGSLPPIEPAASEPGQPTSLTAPGGEDGKGTPYIALVPPEYNPARSYPVLVALPNLGETPAQVIAGMAPYAARWGYIIVSPEWADPFQNTYEATDRLHTLVLDTLKDVRRRYQVDSDRVFLFGFAHAGTAVMSVGMSHPDQFAGVVAISPAPHLQYVKSHWSNAQGLPMYIVTGDQAGSSPQVLKRLFDEWIPKGYPSLFVIYKGRGTEFYEAELQNAFDWMGRKRRATGWPVLGRYSPGLSSDESFHALRQSDNRFYWLSSTSIDRKFTPENVHKTSKVLVPARFQGTIRGNDVYVTVHGLRQLTVWLGRGMVDFERPVTIRVKGIRDVVYNNRNQPLKPSLETMLEDLADRGDRQQLFWYRLDIDNP